MIFIAHRGNLYGKNKLENNPSFIDKALKLGYNVEIDVWKIGDKIFLGHDSPEYEVENSYLLNDNFWCHAKNLESLEWMLENNIRCFWHQEDDFTLTSDKIIWTYPGKNVTSRSVIVCQTLEDFVKYSEMNVYGICSDYVGVVK